MPTNMDVVLALGFIALALICVAAEVLFSSAPYLTSRVSPFARKPRTYARQPFDALFLHR